MKKLLAIALAAVTLSGCIKEEEKGIGVVPLEGAKVSGKIVDVTPEVGVLLKTDGGRTALLPDSWSYRENNSEVVFGKLTPGMNVTATAPGGDGRLLTNAGKNLVLASSEDTYTLPLEALPAASRTVPVRVQTVGGQPQTLPLQDAVYGGQDYTILSHPSYQDYNFPQADPYSLSRAYPVGYYNNEPLALVPSNGYYQAVAVPPQYYPTSDLRTGQPVRFTYYDDNVGVTSWNTLQDGQIDISDVLLAGTLLKVFDGKARIDIGSQPVIVPQSYVFRNNRPVAWNTITPGTPVNVRYYPGVYDVVDYSRDILTVSYQNQMVQLPLSRLPEPIYQRPIAVRYSDGPHKRIPLGQAKKMVNNQRARFVYRTQKRKHWKQNPQAYYGSVAPQQVGRKNKFRGENRAPRKARKAFSKRAPQRQAVNYGNRPVRTNYRKSKAPAARTSYRQAPAPRSRGKASKFRGSKKSQATAGPRHKGPGGNSQGKGRGKKGR